MDLLPCGHTALRDERRACRHLLVDEPPECFLVLTGDSMRYDLACAAQNPRTGALASLDGELRCWRP